MKQLLQFVKDGRSEVMDVPAPARADNKIIIRTAASLVSAGTERMVVDFAEKNLLDKARSRPDLVRQTIDKAQREGILTTYEAVQNRLEQPMALGYSCAGTVIEVGEAVREFKVGDRVACAGGGYAVHAEYVAVPANLVAPLPDAVDFETAAFTTLAAIALQGIRLADVKLGEVIAVIGLGLLGQLTVQMLKAAGCVVIGFDIQADRARLALDSGADEAVADADQFASLCVQATLGYGVDAALITADTKSNQPVELAGQISRRKGQVVAVGAVSMSIPRKVYYEKEIAFLISSSYGPGRYDPSYEEKGHDYPYAYVRWTENRNMRAFVQMAAVGQVNVQPLISHRFPIAEAADAYQLITGRTGDPFLGVLLTYPEVLEEEAVSAAQLSQAPQLVPSLTALQTVRLGVAGAGNFANATLFPVLKKIDAVELVGIASGRGVSAQTSAERFSFQYATSSFDELLQDQTIDTVALLTRHGAHAAQVKQAIDAGKHVFVEKPLCLNQPELDEILASYESAVKRGQRPVIMVGFNRRFAPYVQELKEHVSRIQEPLMIHYRTNAGFIPADHWTQDFKDGGGRLIGEGIHFIDLVMDLADSTPVCVTAKMLPDSGRYNQDNFLILIEFKNGTMGTISYVANGDKGFSKEMLEVFGGGLSARLDDYRSLLIRQGNTRIKRTARFRQEKGHLQEWQVLADFLTGKQAEPPMTLEGIVHAHQIAFAAQRSLRESRPVYVKQS